MSNVTQDPTTTKEPLPQAYIDDLLSKLNKAAEGYADEVVEAQFKRMDERLAAQKDTFTKEMLEAADEAKHRAARRKHAIGVYCWSLLKAKGNIERAGNIADDFLGKLGEGDETPLKFIDQTQVEKTFNLQDAAAGGALVQGDVFDDFFDVLVPSVAVLALNPERVPMPNRAVTVPGFTGDVTSYYVGEPNTTAIKSEPTTGARKLSAKTQATLVPISNQMLGTVPGPRIAARIEAMARRRMGILRDQKLIRGLGTAYAPKGLRYWAPSANQIAETTTPTIVTALTDFKRLINLLEGADVPMERPGWIFAPRAKNWLMFQAVDGDNKPYFLEEMRGGTLLGFPFMASNNVPTNLGGGTDSEIYLADFSQVLYGEVGQMVVSYHGEGSYTEGGSLVSALERNEQVLRVIDEHDLNVEHEAAVAVITDSSWGA